MQAGDRIAASPGGKAVVLGALDTGGKSRLVVLRLDRAGRTDRSFGRRGYVMLPHARARGFDGVAERGAAIVVDRADRIVVVGTSADRSLKDGGPRAPAPRFRVAAMRLTPTGAIDRSFGVGGQFIGASEGRAFGAVGLPDERLRIVGMTRPGTIAVFGLTPRGQLDLRFGRSGATITRAPARSGVSATALTRDGRSSATLVAGAISRGSSSSFLVGRYLADGRLDPAFGMSGLVGLSSRLGATPLGGAEAIAKVPGLVIAGGSAGAEQPGGSDPASCAVAPLSPSGVSLAGSGTVRTRVAGCVSITGLAPVDATTFLAIARRGPSQPGLLVGTVRWRR